MKKRRTKDASYLRHVREFPCLSCGLHHHSIAHHVQFAEGQKAMSRKVSDYWCVPLCTPCHMDLHSGDEKLWWALKGIEPLEWCNEHATAYQEAKKGSN